MKPFAPGAVASLAFGVLAILLGYVPLLGLALGVTAVVLAVRARRAVVAAPDALLGAELAAAGLVCGIIGTVLSALATLAVFVFLAILATAIAAATGAGAAPHAVPLPML